MWKRLCLEAFLILADSLCRTRLFVTVIAKLSFGAAQAGWYNEHKNEQECDEVMIKAVDSAS